MPKVSPEHMQARRDQIAHAAIAQFAQRGIHLTSIADIVTASELSARSDLHPLHWQARHHRLCRPDRVHENLLRGREDGEHPSRSRPQTISSTGSTQASRMQRSRAA